MSADLVKLAHVRTAVSAAARDWCAAQSPAVVCLQIGEPAHADLPAGARDILRMVGVQIVSKGVNMSPRRESVEFVAQWVLACGLTSDNTDLDLDRAEVLSDGLREALMDVDLVLGTLVGAGPERLGTLVQAAAVDAASEDQADTEGVTGQVIVTLRGTALAGQTR